MTVTIVLPNALRPYAAFRDRVSVDATTIGEALTKLVERYPDLAKRAPTDLAALPKGSGVYRGGMDVRRLQGLETPLVNDDVVTLIVPEGEL